MRQQPGSFDSEQEIMPTVASDRTTMKLSTVFRVSYRIFFLCYGVDMMRQRYDQTPLSPRGIWGHPPPQEKLCSLRPLRLHF